MGYRWWFKRHSQVDPITEGVKTFPLPAETGYANLNTATFGKNGMLWFTGQSGIYGRLNTSTGNMEIFSAPKGLGPYGMAATPNGKCILRRLQAVTLRVWTQTPGRLP
jgi:streptogramin lyase